MNASKVLGTVMLVVLSVVTVFFLGSPALATAFNNPPESNSVCGEWVTDFPYQRNVLLDFAWDPRQWPNDAGWSEAKDLVPGPVPTGSPGTAHYEGWADPDLYPSDWLWFDDSGWAWFDSDPTNQAGGSSHNGVFGGLFPKNSTVNIALHLDNTEDPNMWKNAYSETVYWWDGVGELYWDVVPNTGNVVDGSFQVTVQDGGWTLLSAWYGLSPNPLFEDIEFTLVTDPDTPSEFYIDKWHVATECVPESATLGVLTIGLIPVLLRRKRST